MNVVDYIDWRGDLSFECAPFNPPDSLVFSMLSMFCFRGIVPMNGTVSLYRAVKEFFLRNDGDRLRLGLVSPPDMVPLLKKAAVAPRYRDLPLTMFHTEQDEDCQFGAITVLDGDRAYVCFRGTDDTLAGWKEDFAMCFQCPVPAQKWSVDYLRLLDAALSPREIICCGHSKGGNLAVYSAAFAPEEISRKITAVYNHDGPGFPEEIAESSQYTALLPKIHSYVPQNSIIGMLLERRDEPVVVKSTQKGIFQHDCLSWEIIRDRFVQMACRTAESEIIGKTVSGMLGGMSLRQRREFTDSLFGLLSASNAKTLLELSEGRKELFQAMKTASPETKDAVVGAMRSLLRESRRAAREYASELSEKSKG